MVGQVTRNATNNSLTNNLTNSQCCILVSLVILVLYNLEALMTTTACLTVQPQCSHQDYLPCRELWFHCCIDRCLVADSTFVTINRSHGNNSNIFIWLLNRSCLSICLVKIFSNLIPIPSIYIFIAPIFALNICF